MVTATPNAGWTFLQWLGDASGSNSIVNIRMMRSKVVEAMFGTPLNTTVVGGGNITVSSDAPAYPYGTRVRITAFPTAGNYLLLWANDAIGQTNNPLTFTITNASPTVTAVFAALGGTQTCALTVVADGRGQVTMNPAGNRFPADSDVVLKAIPDAQQEFLGWSGAAGGSVNPLVVMMNSNKVITASFTRRPFLYGYGNAESLSEEGYRLTLLGEFGGVYQILGSTNLQGWWPLGMVTNKWGRVQFTDPEGIRSAHGFYRAVFLP